MSLDLGGLQCVDLQLDPMQASEFGQGNRVIGSEF